MAGPCRPSPAWPQPWPERRSGPEVRQRAPPWRPLRTSGVQLRRRAGRGRRPFCCHHCGQDEHAPRRLHPRVRKRSSRCAGVCGPVCPCRSHPSPGNCRANQSGSRPVGARDPHKQRAYGPGWRFRGRRASTARRPARARWFPRRSPGHGPAPTAGAGAWGSGEQRWAMTCRPADLAARQHLPPSTEPKEDQRPCRRRHRLHTPQRPP
mmetsp:Transcript_95416/g.309212  ORF Transcript_95416/g.309212 Transcript_95416/m.309212 type:complete len:208 (-) Transcript_95416:205-828(-)